MKSSYSLIVLLMLQTSFAESKFPDLSISISEMKRTVSFLTEIRPFRNYENVFVLDSIADWIKNEFQKNGLIPEYQEFEVNHKQYKNVIGVLNPEKSQRIIIGAHYDVCGNQPGADDNASAIAGLIETASVLKQFETEIDFRIDFVAYTLEEPPFFRTKNMGSYIHAKSLNDAKVDVRAMFCLEMIGFYTDDLNSQEYPTFLLKPFYPSTGNFIALVSNFKSGKVLKKAKSCFRNTNLPVETLKAPSFIAGVDFSDHKNYWTFNIPAIMITDTAFYRNGNYHGMGDTMNKLDFLKMAEVVKGLSYTIINQ